MNQEHQAQQKHPTTQPSDAEPSQATWLDLYDYRARVARSSAERAAGLSAGEDPAAVWMRWRVGKDALYANHPQTPLGPQERTTFSGLAYFPYDPAFAVEATLEPANAAPSDVPASDVPASGPLSARFPVAGLLRFVLLGMSLSLQVYWIDVYGGGLFCPVRDATSGHGTYGGGRYLFDTVKGSDIVRLDTLTTHDENTRAGSWSGGYAGGRVALDFNYLYNPSCAYDSRWACPLAPSENILPVAISAGELAFVSSSGSSSGSM